MSLCVIPILFFHLFFIQSIVLWIAMILKSMDDCNFNTCHFQFTYLFYSYYLNPNNDLHWCIHNFASNMAKPFQMIPSQSIFNGCHLHLHLNVLITYPIISCISTHLIFSLFQSDMFMKAFGLTWLQLDFTQPIVIYTS